MVHAQKVVNCCAYPCILDTGHFFHTSSTQGLLLRHTQKVKNPKVESFLRAPEDFEGLRSRKEKMTKTPSFFWKKIN